MKQSKQAECGHRQNLCVSVFKNGTNETTTEIYTRKWIDLINRIEKRKCMSS